MTDELIKLLKLDKLDVNKDLSYAQFDKESLKVHIYLNIKFISCPKCGSINKKNMVIELNMLFILSLHKNLVTLFFMLLDSFVQIVIKLFYRLILSQML